MKKLMMALAFVGLCTAANRLVLTLTLLVLMAMVAF